MEEGKQRMGEIGGGAEEGKEEDKEEGDEGDLE